MVFWVTSEATKKVKKNRSHQHHHNLHLHSHRDHYNGGINRLAVATTDTNIKNKILGKQDGGVRDETMDKGGTRIGTGAGDPPGVGIAGHSDSDTDEADYEPMDTCPAFGCGHECLPIYLA